jgi:hypothetical protein
VLRGRANQHGQVIEPEYSDWVAIGVKHVVIVDPVLTGTVQNHRIHNINIS